MKFHYYNYYLIVTTYNNEGSEDLNLKNTMVCQLDTKLVTNFTITSIIWFWYLNFFKRILNIFELCQ